MRGMSRVAVLLCSLVPLLFPACATGPTARPASGSGAVPFADFVGSWRGTLVMHGGPVPQRVAMGLDVEPQAGDPSRYRFVLRYGGTDVRDYLLIVDDAATGDCRIDERNGIELRARLVPGELIAVFAVGGSTLVTRYRRVGDGVEFALESFEEERGVATGHGVTTYAKVALQRALLLRQ